MDNATITATAVRFDAELVTVELNDGRVISAPLDWFPRLSAGTSDERANWTLPGAGHSIRWPDLEEDIRVTALLAGRRSAESAASLKRWMEKRATTV